MRRYSALTFPPYRHRPGRTPHPVLNEDGHSHGQEEPTPDPFIPACWKDCEDYLWGVDLFNHRYFWEAHEAWEGIWRTVRGKPEGDFLRGLIQVAAAFLKGLEGRETGVGSLREKAYAKLRPLAAAGETYCGIRLAVWMEAVDSVLLELAHDGEDALLLSRDRIGGVASPPGWRIHLQGK